METQRKKVASNKTSIKLLFLIPFCFLAFFFIVLFRGSSTIKHQTNSLTQPSSVSSPTLLFNKYSNYSSNDNKDEGCERILHETDIEFQFINYLEFYFCIEFLQENTALGLFLLVSLYFKRKEKKNC